MNLKFTSYGMGVSALLVFVTIPSFSANRYWVGSGAGNWNSTSNWSNVSGGATGFSVPGFADVAIFDGGNISNCTINANVNVNGFTMSTPYSGIVSLNTGITATIAASGFSQTGGTFTGNNGDIAISGPFSQTAGTFTSSTGTLLLQGGYTHSGGTFNHNNGTVSFSLAQTITGNTSFYNLLFVANGGIYTIAAGTTISSINNVTINGIAAYTINTGVLEIKGNLTLTFSGNNSVNGGTATFLFNGTGAQHINSAVSTLIVGTNERICALPNIEIDKTSGSLDLAGVITLNGTAWKTTAGASLVNPGTSTVNINSSVTFSGQNLSLYDIHIWANDEFITLSPATYVLTSTHNVTINGGNYYRVNTGTLELLGDLTLINTSTSALNGGTGTFLFAGTGTQTIHSSVSNLNFVCALPSIKINKTSGTLNLTGIINFNGSSWNTVAGTSLIHPGTSVVNVLAAPTFSGQNLSLYDLVITGNFTTMVIGSGITCTSTHLLTLAGGANWYQINTGTLNAKGDVLVTNTNTSNNVGGSTILLFDGTANQTLTGSGVAGGGRLPNVQINKTGGTLTLANNLISTDKNWTYIAGTVDANTHASTVDFYKTGTIDGQGTSVTMPFHHVITSGLITLGGNMDVDGDFTIRSGVNNRLDITAANNYQLNVAGNWTNNNSVTATSFNEQGGTVFFDGGSSQALTLALATHTETFYNLEMGNTGSGLTLHAPATVSNNVHFVTGNITSSASNILQLNNASTSTGASNGSFVSGPVHKIGNQAFVFPVGKNAVYAPISISAPAVNTDRFAAEYFQTDPNPLYNVTSKDVGLDHISRCEYWILDRAAGTSNVSVLLSWDTRSCGVTDLNSLRVARWNGTQWKDEGHGSTTGSTASGTILSAAAITAFSPFTLASNMTANPLPIELIHFSGQCQNRTTVLHWSTASEINNDYFTLEHSTDGINWTISGTVDGAGNSLALLDYSFTDTELRTGISYFRLKQTDFDGNFEYSDIIGVKDCGENTTGSEITFYPNPAGGIFYIAPNDNAPIYSIEIYAATGEKVYHSGNTQPFIDLSDKPDGIYFAHIRASTGNSVQKIIIRR